MNNRDKGMAVAGWAILCIALAGFPLLGVFAIGFAFWAGRFWDREDD